MTATAQRLGVADLHGRVRALFSSTPRPAGAPGPGRIGVEVELVPVRRGPSLPEPVALTEVASCLAADAGLLDDGRISFEPGGQLELSPPPKDTAAECLDALDRLLDRLRRCGDAAGIELCGAALNPWHDTERIGLQNDAPRYLAMQEHFDRIGPDGRRMMRQTAAVQVCLDIGAPTRWELLNHAGPALAAAFSASPVDAGRLTGMASGRLDIWLGVDPDRTGFDGRHLDGDREDGYTRLALGAIALPVPRRGDAGPAEPQPLEDWLLAGDGRPDAADLDHHITTLFPPVRPRGYLELRCLDGLPRRHLEVAVSTVAALCSDPGVEREALSCVRPEARAGTQSWGAAARSGMRDAELQATALDLLGLAAATADDGARGYLPRGAGQRIARFREQLTARGQSPADELVAAYRADPEDPTPWT